MKIYRILYKVALEIVYFDIHLFSYSLFNIFKNSNWIIALKNNINTNKSTMIKTCRFVPILCMGIFYAYSAFSQQPTGVSAIPLTSLEAFQQSGKNWIISSDAGADFTKDGDIHSISGIGAVVNIVTPNNHSHLITKESFGDLALELDFMMTKNSNSGVYLQGRYEIQLFDSWTKLNPTFSDCGGIYQRWDESRGNNNEGYEGIAPLMNVAKAPGLWQHLKVIFRAPKFNEKGKKISDAIFEQVYLNGALIHIQVKVTGPTRASIYEDEQPAGPLMFQGDHGNIAFRNIQYSIPDISAKNEITENPIIINPEGKPYLLRSYLNFGDKKLTHVISVGNPNQLNFSYDLKQGALFQIWRGDFLEVTDMWHERGEPQLAKPLGAVITLSDAPALAVLTNPLEQWPNSIAFDDFQNKGYTLDANRFPTFLYAINTINVSDKFSSQGSTSLLRELQITGAPEGLYIRLASDTQIELIGNGLYAIGNKNYYITVADSLKPVIRKSLTGQELIVAIPVNTASLSYSITW